MKQILICLTAILIATCIFMQAQAKPNGKPAVTINEKQYDFGTVHQSEKTVTHVFEITNSGNAPLVIISANASCGCTRPTYTSEPIAPGEKGEIKVTFIPSGQRGQINKEVKVRTNAPDAKRITLRITGNVIP